MTEENTEFNFQKALKGIQEGKPFTGKDGVLTSLIKDLAEAALRIQKILPGIWVRRPD